MTELTQELVRRADSVTPWRWDASRRNRTTCSSSILAERQSGPALILRHFGTDGEAVTTRLLGIVRDVELRDEKLRKRYELPPFLKQFADQPESARAAGQDSAGVRPRGPSCSR